MSKRVCSTEGCGTLLSAYNGNADCAQHGGGPLPFDYFLDGRLAEVLKIDDWQLRAACRGEDVAMFDPELPSNDRPLETTKAAKRRCAYCPVRRECLDFAFRNAFYNWTDPDDPHGGSADGMVYGGMTGRERAKLRRYPDRLERGMAQFDEQFVSQRLDVLWRDAGVRADTRWTEEAS